MRPSTGSALVLALLASLTMVAPAQAVAAGIAGTVTGPGDVPLSGIPVTAYTYIFDDPGDQVVAATTTTDAQGEYLLPVTGNGFVVCFESDDYVHECWDGDYRSSDPIDPRYGDLVNVPVEGVTGIDASLIVGSSISGTVTTENGAAPDVTVVAYLGIELYFATTESDGSYTLPHLEPGTYTVCAYSGALIKRCTGDVGGPASFLVDEDDVVTDTDIAFVSYPHAMRIAETGADRIRWTWDPVPGATQYRVAISRSPSMSSPTFRWVTGTKATFTGLPSGVTYYAAVRAYGSESRTAPSAVVRARAGAAGGLLSVNSASPTSHAWTWSRYVGASKYQLQISSSPTFGGYRAVKTSALKAGFSGLAPSTTYYARVRPLKLSGMPLGGWSHVVPGFTGPA